MPVCDELRAREPLFHRAELGTARADFERMTAPSFWEIGASGARYDRAFVLEELERRHAAPVVEELEVQNFECAAIASDTYLVTYTLVQEGTRVSRRATIWRRGEEGWQALYHQGTLVATAAPADAQRTPR